jgi:hypothetical protein
MVGRMGLILLPSPARGQEASSHMCTTPSVTTWQPSGACMVCATSSRPGRSYPWSRLPLLGPRTILWAPLVGPYLGGHVGHVEALPRGGRQTPMTVRWDMLLRLALLGLRGRGLLGLQGIRVLQSPSRQLSRRGTGTALGRLVGSALTSSSLTPLSL